MEAVEGVNSWALYLHLIEQGEVPGKDFEAVFVNHGTDWPESYEYMDMMLAKGYPVTVIRPEVEGFSNLYEYNLHYRMLPARQIRNCTDKFKVTPLLKYHEKPCVVYIGIDSSEPQRAKVHERNGETYDYPLVTAGIDRHGCIDIIKRHGLPVPPKSGCYICPFQRRSQWIELREKHPNLFCKVVRLENLCNERRAAAGKKPVYFRDRPLEALVQVKSGGRLAVDGQTDFEDALLGRPPCRCGL